MQSDEMNSTSKQWINGLIDAGDDAQASAEFQEWLDVQSRFHEYSYQNTLLIKRQYPDATKVASYRTWQEEFVRHVQEGESAIWSWAPIITSSVRSARTRRPATRTATDEPVLIPRQVQKH